MIEKIEVTQEKSMRINMKQTSKGFWHSEFGVKSDSVEELKAKFEQLKSYVLSQLRQLNGK